MVTTAGTLTSVTDQLTSVFRNQGITIFNGILIVVTISGEQLFHKLSFKCPCAYPQNVVYGGAFIFVPAISLFLVGILINGTTWRIIHGCCYRASRTRHGYRRSAYYWMMIVSQASVAPVAWLFVAFLQGSYYECLRAGDYCRMPLENCTALFSEMTAKEPRLASVISGGPDNCVDPLCVCDLKKFRDYSSRYLISFSQIIAWALLLTSVLVVLIFLLISRCTDRYTFAQNFYVNLYRELEEKKFAEEAKMRAEKLATQNVKTFFDKSMRSKLDWDKISVVPLSDLPHYFDFDDVLNRREPYFSPLDEWARDHTRVAGEWRETLKTLSNEHLGGRLFDSAPDDLHRRKHSDNVILDVQEPEEQDPLVPQIATSNGFEKRQD